LWGNRGNLSNSRYCFRSEIRHSRKFIPHGEKIGGHLWGGEDEPGIEIATEGAKARIEEERAEKANLKQDREA
jgi:hypothetical protein